MSINQYLPDDIYKPKMPKPSLQQYDNYQIYDIHCVDINYQVDTSTKHTVEIVKNKSTLAVQAYSINPILCDFNAIVNAYK